MALNINTNISSLTAPQINRAVESSDETTNRLNSGLRINTAKDDAVGLDISNSNLNANSVGKEAINTLQSIAGGNLDANQIDNVRKILKADYNENVKDVDYAAESANFQKHNILSQAGSFASSQAYAQQSAVHQLLALG